MENEIVIKKNKIVRIYSVEEYEKYFNKKKYVSWGELSTFYLLSSRYSRKIQKNKSKDSLKIAISEHKRTS